MWQWLAITKSKLNMPLPQKRGCVSISSVNKVNAEFPRST